MSFRFHSAFWWADARGEWVMSRVYNLFSLRRKPRKLTAISAGRLVRGVSTPSNSTAAAEQIPTINRQRNKKQLLFSNLFDCGPSLRSIGMNRKYFLCCVPSMEFLCWACGNKWVNQWLLCCLFLGGTRRCELSVIYLYECDTLTPQGSKG